MKLAMKAKDKPRLGTIRLIQSEFKRIVSKLYYFNCGIIEESFDDGIIAIIPVVFHSSNPRRRKNFCAIHTGIMRDISD